MNAKEEVEKEENGLNESTLSDLSPADESTDATKGGAPNFAGTWTLDKSKTQF